MKGLCRPVLVTLVSVLCVLPAAAQQTDESSQVEKKRPTIGLVLGGGGARGAAHIGVIKELERQRIPIDAIAGVSMGSIVGGLYASGMSSGELEELVQTLDWSAGFKDSQDRTDKRYRRKQDDAAYPMKLELGLRDWELILPKGIVYGQNLGLILRQLTLDVSSVSDFDDLPIPYRAVAADLVTGEPVVMGSGDLAQTIRASMSAPGVFSPAEIDGRVLVDGGLVGNVPVSAMRDMGVDIIIAVDVEFPLYKADELNSAVSISAQMLTILIRKETQRQLAQLTDDDFLLRPALGEFGSANFAEIAEAVMPGEDAARAIAGELASLALSEEAYAEHVASRPTYSEPDTVDFVRVKDSGTLSAKVVTSRLKTEAGDKFDATALGEDANHLYGLQLYQDVDYKVVTDNDETGVEFVATAKDWGPTFLQFGLALEDDFEGNSSFDVAAQITRSGINRLGAEWRTDLQLGTQPFVFTEFYQPLSFNSRYFISPNFVLEARNFNIFISGENLARYRVSDSHFGFDVGRELGLWGELRFGMFTGSGDAQLKIGDPAFPKVKFNTGGWFGRFNVDTLDNAQIPLKGLRARFAWESSREGFGADANFDRMDGFILGAWTHGRHTLNATLKYGTSRDSDNLPRNYFTLGGFLNLSGLERGSISGAHMGLGRLVYYRRTGEVKGTLEVPFYVGASIEAGNVWQSRDAMNFDDALINGSLFIGADTFIGSMFLAAGFGEGGATTYYLSVGNTPTDGIIR